jgi:hypothetical protein
MVAYVESAVPGKDALRIAAYEFRYESFLQVLKNAIYTGTAAPLASTGVAMD